MFTFLVPEQSLEANQDLQGDSFCSVVPSESLASVSLFSEHLSSIFSISDGSELCCLVPVFLSPKQSFQFQWDHSHRCDAVPVKWRMSLNLVRSLAPPQCTSIVGSDLHNLLEPLFVKETLSLCVFQVSRPTLHCSSSPSCTSSGAPLSSGLKLKLLHLHRRGCHSSTHQVTGYAAQLSLFAEQSSPRSLAVPDPSRPEP